MVNQSIFPSYYVLGLQNFYKWHHPDFRRILYEEDSRLQLRDAIEIKVRIDIKVKSAEELEYGLDNPYILAQIANVGNFDHFKTKIKAKYKVLLNDYYDEQISPEEYAAHYAPMLAKLEAAIELEKECVIERAGATARREMGLKTHVKWRSRERKITGTLAVLGTAASVASASVATTATVLSMGGTVLAAGLSIHSATKSLINTYHHLNSFYVGYQKSLDRATASLRFMQNTIAGGDMQGRSTEAHHVAQAMGQVLVGDIAEPYKRAKRHFENADYRLGKIELKLQDMGSQISAVLRETDTLNRLLQIRQEEIGRLMTNNSEQQNAIASLVSNIERLKGQLTALETALSLMLTALSGMAEPIQTSMQQLEAVRESLVSLKPTKRAGFACFLVAAVAGAITGGLSYASKQPEMFNMRLGAINNSMESLDGALSWVSFSLGVVVPVWDVARDLMHGVEA